jgi:hypothetical protein
MLGLYLQDRWLKIGGEANLYGKQPVDWKRVGMSIVVSQKPDHCYLAIDSRLMTQDSKLFIPLLMTVLSQSFFTLMRRNLMTLSFFTTRHTQIIF